MSLCVGKFFFKLQNQLLKTEKVFYDKPFKYNTFSVGLHQFWEKTWMVSWNIHRTFFQPEPFWWFRVVPESRTPFFLEWSKTVGKINRDPNQKDMVPHMSRHVLFEIQQILVNLDQSLRKSELASEQSKIIEALVLGKLRTWSALDTDKALLYIWYFIKVFSHNFVSWIKYL